MSLSLFLSVPSTGLGKCIGTVGGSLLVIIPAAVLLSQLVGGTKIQAVVNAFRDVQKQLGVFNPDLARFVDENRDALAAGLFGLGVLPLIFAPGLCGNASSARPLSSRCPARSSPARPPASKRQPPARSRGTRAQGIPGAPNPGPKQLGPGIRRVWSRREAYCPSQSSRSSGV